ncbi:MAG: hypothetical protein RMI94_15370 [Bryobacterales bacterium]|nr:hypothetical protein [Bryobacterales bacterium]
MSSPRYRWFFVAVGLLLVFAAAVALVLHFLPRPLSSGDYLVAGSVATLITLLALFIFLLVAGLVTGRFFLRPRRKG